MLAKVETNKELRTILMVMARWWNDLAKVGPKAPDAEKRRQSE
jgi:hypothetical protein